MSTEPSRNPRRNVLITGAASGIGKAVAGALLGDGHKVTVVDVNAESLATAEKDLGQAIATHFGPNKADLILECVGVQATADQAVTNARKGTTIVIVGVFGGKPTIDLGLVQDRELSLVGTLMYQKADYAKAIELIATGKIKLDHLITHRFKFEQYLDAYHIIEESNGRYMKVMIELD